MLYNGSKNKAKERQTNTTTTVNRQMTPAELDRLHRLANKIETAKNFTQSSKAIEQMNAFQEHLMAKGVTVETILKAMGN